MSKILIVEDDKNLCEQVRQVLCNYGYEVAVISDFNHVCDEFIQVAPDLVLLDINLPHYDGNYYCRWFRKQSDVPIIMTSARNSDLDQIMSMELGADEYVVKPFSIPVLLAKINAILRRFKDSSADTENQSVLRLKNLELSENTFRLQVDNTSIELSKTEYKLMHCFMQKPDQIIAREELLEEIWDMNTFVDDNTLTVNVTRMKSKLLDLGICDVIKTKRGSGYLFDTTNL